MTFRQPQEVSRFQESTNDRFDNWAHQASNDATDFFRGQSRGNTPGRMANDMMDHLEITPLFGNQNNGRDNNYRGGNDRYMNMINRIDPDLADIVSPCPRGFDQKKWYGGHQSPEYTIARGLAGSMDELRNIPDAAGRRQFVGDLLERQVPALERQGARVDAIDGDRIKIDFGTGRGAQWIDTVRDLNGRPEVQLINVTSLMRNQEAQGRTPNSDSAVRRPSANDRLPTQDRVEAPKVFEKAPCPPGFDPEKWNNGHDTPKYVVGHMVADWLQHDLKTQPREGQKARAEEFLKSQVPYLESKGYKVKDVQGEKLLIDIGFGTGYGWADVIVNVEGKNANETPHASWQV